VNNVIEFRHISVVLKRRHRPNRLQSKHKPPRDVLLRWAAVGNMCRIYTCAASVAVRHPILQIGASQA